VTANPTICQPPSAGVYNDEVLIYYRSCNCVTTGESVTFTVHTFSDARPLWTYWDEFGHVCPGVLVKSFRVVDVDGDHDGYPDTNETFELWIGISNKWPVGLTGVVARVSTEDPRIDCILEPAVAFGDLPPDADAEATVPFLLHVHPDAERGGSTVVCNNPGPGGTCSNFVSVSGGCQGDADCRRGVADDYSARITVTISANQPGAQTRPHAIPLELDLDSDHMSALTTTFHEGFEAGFGAFVFQNLDANKASNSLSDGYRCQYNDPDFINSNSYGDTECYLGFASGQTPANDWHYHTTMAPDGGRAYSGTRSLHYGKHTPASPLYDTYGLSQMDAVRIKSSINLAARICWNDPAADRKSCSSDADCLGVGGGPCVSSSPALRFKHQVSLTDDRNARPGPDRAVVYVQTSGSPIWEKVSPFENVYNMQASDYYSNCRFDPVDDGNNEDSYFDPTDPYRRLGPSSTCYPELAFSYLGDTDEPFDPARIGSGSDGPGLQGSLGPGTWVESRFDLSRYRGRSILVRFLLTSIKISDTGTWEAAYMWNPLPDDDGWYIDDVEVSETLGTASPTVGLDTSDNSALPGNLDRDARGDECDCAPADPGAFALPEVTALTLAPDRLTLTWDSAIPIGGSATVHDVLRGILAELPVGSGPSEACLASGTQEATATDAAVPVQGSGYWYLVRCRNSCGLGTYGFQRDAIERTSAVCP